MQGKMKKRIVFGSLMILGVVGLFMLDWWVSGRVHWPDAPYGMAPAPLDGLVITLLAVVLAGLSLRELSALVKNAGLPLLEGTALIGVMAVAGWPYSHHFVPIYAMAGPNGCLPNLALEFALLAVIVLLAFAEQMIRFRIENAIARIAGTLLGILYLGLGAAIIVAIRLDFGMLVLVLFLVAVKFTDMGAYFTGSAIGKHKMIPWLSPGKTWEGLAGGLVAAAGASMLVVAICRATDPGYTTTLTRRTVYELTYAKAAIFGVIVGLAGQFGDLCESLLKRSAGAKDSGAMLPEFGGLLDILDSPLLAAPVAYALLTVLRSI
jgi:phosphatidate cytidylyltransferase